MNLPNKLTILRTILIPFYLVALLWDIIPAGRWIALAIFMFASLTDMWDGQIARKYNLITNFGKFMDPLADKLLVCSAMIAFVEIGTMPAWAVIVIISREFIISGFRLIASDKGIVIAADIWGKIKTVEQMIMICFLTADLGDFIDVSIGNMDLIMLLEDILIYAAVVLTVISLVNYMVKNKEVLADSK